MLWHYLIVAIVWKYLLLLSTIWNHVCHTCWPQWILYSIKFISNWVFNHSTCCQTIKSEGLFIMWSYLMARSCLRISTLWEELLKQDSLQYLISFLGILIFLANRYAYELLINPPKVYWIRVIKISCNNHLASYLNGECLLVKLQEFNVRRIGSWLDPTIGKFSILAFLYKLSRCWFITALPIFWKLQVHVLYC